MYLSRGHKVRLMPNSHQERLFRRFAGAARFAWNESLAFYRAYREEAVTRRAAVEASYANLLMLEGASPDNAAAEAKAEAALVYLTPTQKQCREHLRDLRRTICPWLADIPECVTKQAVKDLFKAYAKSYKNQREGKVVSRRKDRKTGKVINPYGFPEFHKKDARRLSFYQRTDAYRVVDRNHVKLTGIPKPVKVKYRHMPEHVNNPRVTFDGRFWYLSWSEPCDVEPLDGAGTVGIDVGMVHIAVTSDGVFYDIPEQMNRRIQRLRQRKKYLQRRLSHKEESNKDANGHVIETNNIRKLKAKIADIDRKIANASGECRQLVVNDIMRSRPKTVIVEDLNVRGMFANRHLSKKLQRVGLGEFLSMLEWACERHGVELVKADRYFPSTQLCSECGEQTGPRGFEGLKIRKWTCPACGTDHDRDLNASYNLRDYTRSGFVRRSIKARGDSRKTQVAAAKAESVKRVAKVGPASGDAGR